MEKSNSEMVFESLNLSPRLFINEIRNAVDDLLGGAFGSFLDGASKLLQTEGTERSAELIEGVEYVRDAVFLKVQERMQKWEEYCLHFCFSLPEDISLHTAANDSQNVDMSVLASKELDEELNLLRRKLAKIERENAELTRELQDLEEGRSLRIDQSSSGSINELLSMYNECYGDKLFRELTAMASTFRERVLNLKRKSMEEIQFDAAEKMKFCSDVRKH